MAANPKRSAASAAVSGLRSGQLQRRWATVFEHSSRSLFGRRWEVGARIDLELFAIHVIPRERRGLDALDKLNLKYGESVISERRLEPGQVVFPHPDEPFRAAEPRAQFRRFIEQPDDLVALGKEVGPPCMQRVRIVDAQDFDVADDQARAFDRGGKFRECWLVASWEDVTPNPGIGLTRAIPASDRVEQYDAVIRQQVTAFAKERRVVLLADVLEHSDRDDAVELFRDGPIILDAKFARGPRGGRALLRDTHLLVG